MLSRTISATLRFWSQRLSERADGLACWDYHVILVRKTENQTLVYDLDSTLPFPVDFKTYVDKTLIDGLDFAKEFHPKFKIIKGRDYYTDFSSDRSHMFDADNNWLASPPKWPAIKPKDQFFTLNEMLDLANGSIGQVVDLNGFIKFLK